MKTQDTYCRLLCLNAFITSMCSFPVEIGPVVDSLSELIMMQVDNKEEDERDMRFFINDQKKQHNTAKGSVSGYI